MSVEREKQAVREKVWRLLEQDQAVPANSYGTIPGFYGAEQTAVRLAELEVWQRARTVKANPDYAQLPVRARALKDGKLLYMAVPRMADAEPFFLLDPGSLTLPIEDAVDPGRSAGTAERVGVGDMRPIDVVVCGSVAVNRLGARIGKGAGYSDIEVALLIEAGLVTDRTVIVAPVHRLQVLDDDIPETAHDFRVDFVITPDEVIPCPPAPRPRGIIWGDLPADKIEAIPVLAAQARDRLHGR